MSERQPYRIPWSPVGPVPDELLWPRVQALKAPLLEPRPFSNRRLAVVGGGPSLVQHLDELKRFDGDIWAINQTAQFLLSHGIDCTLFVIDPLEEIALHTAGVKKALVASICDPKVFDGLKDAEVWSFHVDPYKGSAGISVIGGSSAASRAPMLAIALGYIEVTWYGCEGSFTGDTHVYRNEPQHLRQLIIKAGYSLYRTRPDLLITCEHLADAIGKFPGLFFEKSGGLLRGMIEHRNTWSIVALSDSLRDELDPTSTEPFDVSLCA